MTVSTEYQGNQPSEAYKNDFFYERPAPNLTPMHEMAFRVRELERITQFFGPSLVFKGQEDRQWNVSMLLTVARGGNLPEKVILKYGGRSERVDPIHLEEWNGYDFYRYDFTVHQAEKALSVAYKIDSQRYGFWVPGYDEKSRILCCSCNGVQYEKDKEKFDNRGGLHRMWHVAGLQHEKKPFHVLNSNGDTIYMDPTPGLFDLPTIADWLKLDHKTRNSHQFTEHMREEVEEYFLNRYFLHFFDNGSFTRFLSTVPAMMLMGDHDGYDGLGSYPPELQNSNVMEGIKEIAERIYLLNQQHASKTNIHSMESMGLFGNRGHCYLRAVDRGELAFLGVDTRMERTREKIVEPATYDMIFERLTGKLPPNCKFLAVMIEIALIYVSIQSLEHVLNEIGKDNPLSAMIRSILKHTPGMLNAFGLAELDDDARDEWSCHLPELISFLNRLMEFCKARNIELVFMSGDAHNATTTIAGPEGAKPSDPGVVHQLITSAIVNAPPPKRYAKFFRNELRRMEEVYGENLIGKVIPLKKKGSEKTEILFNKRNFGVLRQTPKGLKWELYVEPKKGDRLTNVSCYRYTILRDKHTIESSSEGSGDTTSSESSTDSALFVKDPVFPVQTEKNPPCGARFKNSGCWIKTKKCIVA